MRFDDAIENRRSVRKFSEKKFRWQKIIDAVYSANQAPFAGNINNVKFVIIKDSEKKEKIAKSCQQEFIIDAPYIVVVCSNIAPLKRMYKEDAEKYSKQQVGAAIENFLLKITDMKLSACWIGLFLEEPIKELLSIPSDIEIEAIIPIGYPHKKAKVTKKKNPNKSVYFENWEKSKDFE